MTAARAASVAGSAAFGTDRTRLDRPDAKSDADLARTHWRRQLLLVAASTGAGVVAIALMVLSITRESAVRILVLADGSTVRSASATTTLWPAALGIAVLLVVFAFVVVHMYRVAAFTFRRGAL